MLDAVGQKTQFPNDSVIARVGCRMKPPHQATDDPGYHEARLQQEQGWLDVLHGETVFANANS